MKLIISRRAPTIEATALATMLQAVKAVRPAFEAFEASLTTEQKAALNRIGPRH